MFNATPMARRLAVAFGGLACAALSATSAQAQTTTAAPPQTAAQKLERVQVTGSLIRRIEGETALPVVTLNVDTLQAAGVSNAEQAVRFITEQQGGTVTSGSVSGTNGAASYASLRSLGSSRTLVLLNGKRVVNNPFSSSAVDLNSLPMAALERIEVLTDGASATYGTDAIAGVINFITRKEYKGIAVGGEAQMPQESGGRIYTGNILGGWGELNKEGWNIFGGFNYRKQDPMLGTDRDFSRSAFIPEKGFNGLSPTTFPANYSQSVAGRTVIANTNPTLPNCAPPYSLYTPQGGGIGLGTTRCGADTQGFTETIPEQEQWSVFTRGSLALGQHTASLEYFRSSNRVRSQIAPSPEAGLSMPSTSPYYPGNGITPITDTNLVRTAPISINWRTVPLGVRQGEQENITQRVVGGLDGVVAGWDYNVYALWSNSKIDNTFLNGYGQTRALLNGVAGTNGAPWLNPFGAQSAEGQAYLQANQVLGKVQDGEGTIQSVGFTVANRFFDLPGGSVGIALGAEYRKEEMVYNTDVAKVSQAASSGLAGSGGQRKGDRDITALVAEAAVPILKNLELGFGVRYDDYSDFGGTTNPKVTARYTPINNLLLRASYNKGFSAPSLTSLYLPNQTTFTGGTYNDPLLCPNGVPAANAVPARDCRLQFQQLQGGNDKLQPEKSDAFTVGFVLQPVPSTSVSLDYWNYKVTDSISTLGETTIFGDTAKYASLFVRCSQAGSRAATIGACRNPGSADPLAYIINTNQNLGDVKTSGVDLSVAWTGTATNVGRFNAGVRGTYVLNYEFQTEPNGIWYNPVGNYNAQFGGPVIRYQQVANVGWEWNAWSATLFHRYTQGYKDQNGTVNAPPFRDNTVGAYSIFDIGGSWKGIKGLSINAGILNLFDTDPPFSNQSSRFQARGYDDRFANPLGRTFTVGARYEFF